jgi:hypothetical protein
LTKKDREVEDGFWKEDALLYGQNNHQPYGRHYSNFIFVALA